MANYINKNILSQAYIHVEPKGIETEEELEAFKVKLTEFAKSRTDFFLGDNLDINIEFEDGSIKARITIMGTIFILLNGISNYKNFREGLQLLHSDAKWLSDSIISESLYETKAKNQDVIRVEARTGIIGSAHKILNQLELIKSGANGSMLATDIANKIEKVEKDIRKLIDNMNDSNDKLLVTKEAIEIINNLPETPIPPKDKFNPELGIIEYRKKSTSLSQTLNSILHKYS
ncbi:hypothetical protein A9Q81_13660 [Gammaproteobacteria bacterium 42_54_T18]|nr:hypothetical protein A9Q81_13660 [Gammaproteobacteria bacterium 42_54_T18]